MKLKFDFTNRKPKLKSKRKLFDIINKNVFGACHIDISGNYHISHGNKLYDIHKECYDTKGKTILFPQHIKPDEIRKIAYIREKKDAYKVSDYIYLPFIAGVIVKGNIVNFKNNEVFDIKEIILNTFNDESVEAFKFYKDNYEEIRENIRSKYG